MTIAKLSSSKEWDTIWRSEQRRGATGLDFAYLKSLLRLLNPKSGELILEAGCGTASATLSLAKTNDFIPTLLDFSKEALNLARKNASNIHIDAHFILGDIKYLPFINETFDATHNGGVVEHFTGPDRQRIFNEMVRVLKKGGKLVIFVPNAWNIPYRIMKKIMEVTRTWIYGFEEPFSPLELSRRMENCELRVFKTTGIGAFSALGLITQATKIKIFQHLVFSLLKIFRVFDGMESFNKFFGRNIAMLSVKRRF